MRAILSSIVVVGALVCGAHAQTISVTTPPPADLVEMKAAIDRSLANKEITPGEATQMKRMVDVMMAERAAAEIREQLNANEKRDTARQY